MAISPPWLNYDSVPFANVNSDGAAILSVTVQGSISSLLISNQSNGDIIAYVVLIRGSTSYPILTVPLSAYQGVVVLNNNLLVILFGDIISIHTDAPTNLVAGLLSYVEFNELAAP